MPGLLYLVEDEPALRRLLARVARAEGWQVVACADGSELLAASPGGDRPAVLLLDLNMPNTDGITLLRKLAAMSPRLVLVLMTGGAEVNATAARIIAETQGMIVLDTLFKPFPLDRLRRVLQDAAGRIGAPRPPS